MGKERAQTSKMNIHEYLIIGRLLPKEGEENPPVYKMRIFAPNEVMAKSKYWYFLRKQHKIRRTLGEIIAVHEIHEKNDGWVKNYGMIIRYLSRTANHNMYKEYRDTTLCGAVSQMYMEFSGRHRARYQSIHIVKTCIVKKNDDIKRTPTKVYMKNKLAFPLLSGVYRAPIKKYRTPFKANRPAIFKK